MFVVSGAPLVSLGPGGGAGGRSGLPAARDAMPPAQGNSTVVLDPDDTGAVVGQAFVTSPLLVKRAPAVAAGEVGDGCAEQG
jgi:hypothetical protein